MSTNNSCINCAYKLTYLIIAKYNNIYVEDYIYQWMKMHATVVLNLTIPHNIKIDSGQKYLIKLINFKIREKT